MIESDENLIETKRNNIQGVNKPQTQTKSIHTIPSAVQHNPTSQTKYVSNSNPTTKVPKSVSFELEEVDNSNVNDQHQAKRSKRDNSGVNSSLSTNNTNTPQPTTIICVKKDKKYRIKNSENLFGPEGKYSDYHPVDQEDTTIKHSDNLERDSSKKIDEIMPLLHQTSISSNYEENSTDASTLSNSTTGSNNHKSQSQYKREKEKTNGRNSNRKKIKSKSLRNKFITSNTQNNDSDST